MNRGVYSAATAMVTAQQWLDVISNNLANASTTGFKKEGLTFNDGLLREMAAAGGNGRILGTLGSGSIIQAQYTDESSGAVVGTGNPLDLALRTPGSYFAVRTPRGVLYTRDGAFQLDAERQVVDKSGNPVLNTQLEPITVPEGAIKVSESGEVSAGGKAADQIGVFTGSFQKAGHNLSSSTNAQPVETPEVVPGALESSNVNAVEEMVAMIRLNRAFELAQKAIQSQDDSTQRLTNSLQGR